MKKTGNFQIVSEDGTRYQVNEWRKEIETSFLDGTKSSTLGKLADLKTEEGYTVSPLNDGEYHILPLDLVCKKI